jgi:hypothetical protein
MRSRAQLMARFAEIGVGAGKPFDASKLPAELKTALDQGVADAWIEFANFRKQVEAGVDSP